MIEHFQCFQWRYVIFFGINPCRHKFYCHAVFLKSSNSLSKSASSFDANERNLPFCPKDFFCRRRDRDFFRFPHPVTVFAVRKRLPIRHYRTRKSVFRYAEKKYLKKFAKNQNTFVPLPQLSEGYASNPTKETYK
jgi:hypothetical protein